MPGQTKPFWNNFEIYDRMAREKNAFNVNFGDAIYSDTEVGSEQEGGNFTPGAPPQRPLPPVPLGQEPRVFFLDQRSFRDAKASQGGTCDNPQAPARPVQAGRSRSPATA